MKEREKPGGRKKEKRKIGRKDRREEGTLDWF